MAFTVASAMPRKNYGETSFVERLQNIRKARGLTQVQLADATPTTQRAVSYYETGAGFPPAPAVISLAKALHVTANGLLALKPSKAVASVAASSLHKKDRSPAVAGERHGR